jgi:GT2 family glycosyltransferase
MQEAASFLSEPLEAIIVVNGCAVEQYRYLQAEYPDFLWQFHRQPLGFSAAIVRGLNAARHDWVYLLNSDVALSADSLAAAGRHRRPDIFSIASQIVLKDQTRFRDETNRTRLFLENGLATIHDLLPASSTTVEHFYSGAGAAMFQRRLLQRVLDSHVYDPFYWEDVEWGWRTRKLGYRSLFCAESLARHTRQATISKYYDPEQIEAIFERNRLMFQLRNLTSAGSLDSVADAIAGAGTGVTDYFLSPSALRQIAKGRLWNHLAPLADDQLLGDRPWPGLTSL